MELNEYKSRLLKLLKEKALKIGKFKLSSGKESDYYLDERIVTLSSEGAYLTAKVMLDMLKDVKFDAIGGPTLAADPIVTSIVVISYTEGRNIDGFIIRKEPKGHGTGKLIEGPLNSGANVIIVDGTMTTGGSLLKAIQTVESEGCKVVKVIALIDRLEGGKEALESKGYEVLTVFTKNDILDS